MPQLKKMPPGNNPTRNTLSSKTVAGARKRRRTAFIIASVIVVLITAIVGVSLYVRAAPFRRIIITVDDSTINMKYFLMRTRLADADPMEMINTLTNEQLVKIEAPRYVAEVTQEDIEQEVRRRARGESETMSESEFKEWYRQHLNEGGLSDSEHDELIATSLLISRFQQYLAERAPTVAEQVHIHAIAVKELEDAEEIRARWEAGEDFADLAIEVSLDETTQESGGDLGWLPRGILPPGFDQVAFSLTIGDISEPITYVSDPTSTPEIFYYLLMVSEQDEAREIDEAALQILKDGLIDDWLLEEIQSSRHNIEWNFNSEIYLWLNWQLGKE